jgi:uncharacterized protein (TIGR02118 family)
MIKLVFTLRRRPDISAEEFRRYWLEEHAPLVRLHREALGIVRYVQSHRFETALDSVMQASRCALAPYDGIAELWWDSMEALLAASASAKGRAAQAELLKDERRFIDLPSTTIFLTEEHEVYSR